MTGASIALGVVGAIAGLGNVPEGARAHLRFAALLCGFSVVVAAWIAASMPQYVEKNVALESRLNVALALAVYGMALGMISLTLGIWTIFTK